MNRAFLSDRNNRFLFLTKGPSWPKISGFFFSPGHRSDFGSEAIGDSLTNGLREAPVSPSQKLFVSGAVFLCPSPCFAEPAPCQTYAFLCHVVTAGDTWPRTMRPRSGFSLRFPSPFLRKTPLPRFLLTDLCKANGGVSRKPCMCADR